MAKLLEEVGRQMVKGLRRKAITTCSQWAETYRVMGTPFPGPFTFDHHPWTQEVHDSAPGTTICQKAAQMGFSDTALNRTFYHIDIFGYSVLYVLPALKPDAADFSTSRFDPALEMSEHLRNIFGDVKNIGHKRAGGANLFIRGSRSRSQLKSIPVAIIVFDEVDEMVPDNITLALERQSGQLFKDTWYISTPTVTNEGINRIFLASSQDHYTFKCPHCNKYTELIYPDCLVMASDVYDEILLEQSYLRCKECAHTLDHNTKPEWLKCKAKGGTGIWQSTISGMRTRGFWISQLYSMTRSPGDIAKTAILAESDPAAEQELWNSKLGLPHIVKGAKLSAQDIRECIGTHPKVTRAAPGALVTMGVDVGKVLHVEIDQWFIRQRQSVDVNVGATAKLLLECTVNNFEDLDLLMIQFQVAFCIIDGNPERRKALEFAQRFWGKVLMCFYGNSVKGRMIHRHEEYDHAVTVDRTSWLDLSLGRIRQKHIVFPIDLSKMYSDQLQVPTRIYKKDADGNAIGRYTIEKINEPDHFAHARNYAEIALALAVGQSANQSMGSVP
jgi:hypothetical protein